MAWHHIWKWPFYVANLLPLLLLLLLLLQRNVRTVVVILIGVVSGYGNILI